MTNAPYQRTPGDFELRVLKDGRFVLLAPDEDLMALGEAVTQNGAIPENTDDSAPRDTEEQSDAK